MQYERKARLFGRFASRVMRVVGSHIFVFTRPGFTAARVRREVEGARARDLIGRSCKAVHARLRSPMSLQAVVTRWPPLAKTEHTPWLERAG